MRKGFTLIEVLLAAFLAVLFAGMMLLALSQRSREAELDATVKRITALLREAQSRSANQSSSTSWGVHFENSTSTTPFYALFFSATYDTSTRIGYYALPPNVAYATSGIPSGGTKEITFTQITGIVTNATSVKIYLPGNPTRSSTISVGSSGVVSF